MQLEFLLKCRDAKVIPRGCEVRLGPKAARDLEGRFSRLVLMRVMRETRQRISDAERAVARRSNEIREEFPDLGET